MNALATSKKELQYLEVNKSDVNKEEDTKNDAKEPKDEQRNSSHLAMTTDAVHKAISKNVHLSKRSPQKSLCEPSIISTQKILAASLIDISDEAPPKLMTKTGNESSSSFTPLSTRDQVELLRREVQLLQRELQVKLILLQEQETNLKNELILQQQNELLKRREENAANDSEIRANESEKTEFTTITTEHLDASATPKKELIFLEEHDNGKINFEEIIGNNKTLTKKKPVTTDSKSTIEPGILPESTEHTTMTTESRTSITEYFTSLDNIPNELILHITDYCDFGCLEALSFVCQATQKLVRIKPLHPPLGQTNHQYSILQSEVLALLNKIDCKNHMERGEKVCGAFVSRYAMDERMITAKETVNNEMGDDLHWKFRRIIDVVAQNVKNGDSVPHYLYYWDARDSPHWEGWWITPHTIGFTRYCAFSKASTARSPHECNQWKPTNRNFVVKKEPYGSGMLVGNVRSDQGIVSSRDGYYKKIEDSAHNHGNRCVYQRVRGLSFYDKQILVSQVSPEETDLLLRGYENLNNIVFK